MLSRTASALLLSAAASQPCLAQSASPGAAVALDPVTVEAPRRSTPAVARGRTMGPRRADPLPSRESAAVTAAADAAAPASVRARFDALAGGVALVDRQDFPVTANPTVSKALSGVPGVVVQDFFGGNDQPRIQIRGSGLQQNPVERGILVLQNGLPINRADGSYIVGFANPQLAESIEVYRGYMANRLGATVLGGALNFVSPTGSTQPGAQITVSGGSFGQIGSAGQAGFKKDNFDGLIQFDASRRDGFRDYNSSERVAISGNVGVKHSENVSTRFFAGYTDLGFDVAGPLTKSAMYADPRQVHGGPRVVGGVAINPGPNVLRDKPRREASQFLVGSRTTATFDAHLVDVAIGYTHTDDMFRFPISSGIRTTEGGDLTGVVRYAYNPGAAVLPLLETTAQFTTGSASRENYINQAGSTGAKFGQSELDATTLALYSGLNIPIWPAFTLSPAISYAHATRDNDDTYRLATRPTIAYNPANPTMLLPNGAVPTQSTSYSRAYEGWSPSLALSYRPDSISTVFAAVSRSFEPPTHDDLLATVNGTPNSSPGRPTPGNPFLAAAAFTTPDLKAQTATTVEAGWRGRTDRFSWDAVTYYSWVDNELLSLRDATGASLGAINADKTTHFGVELGFGARLTERLSGRVAYTYQDFRFDNDPLRGNNRLAGAPRHLVNAMLQFQATESWRLQGAVRWNPERTPVDNMNTLYADPYVVVDLRTEYKINKTFSVFGEITNLFNETYASSTLIVDQARPDQAAFLPGDGRGFYAGMKARF
ncbi:iron complex outermembrane receptor protein [Bradyrhizobium sp. AZCC 1719]|uniref:TonB-dependent receptor family protein n=1 Tax=Bradyrhizobium sp. AZCC 1719 TaxID=3117028 RepID=UPI002FEEAF93